MGPNRTRKRTSSAGAQGGKASAAATWARWWLAEAEVGAGLMLQAVGLLTRLRMVMLVERL